MRDPDLTDGICRVPVAPLRAEPDHGSEQVSQLLVGESFQIEDRDARGEWWRVVCGADGYRGWLRAWYGLEVATADREAWEARAQLRCARIHASLHAASSSRSPVVTPLPWGARVAPLSESGRWLEVELPDGRRGFLPRRELAGGQAPGGKPTPPRLLKTAVTFLGAPYAWGGRSSWGMDCSGFVQTVFAWHGVGLPRDSTEQLNRVRGGSAESRAARSVESARAGDLLLFGPDDDTATHVGISAGGAEFLHAQAMVRRSSLDPSSELFERQLVSLFLGAWRVPPGPGSRGGRWRETP